MALRKEGDETKPLIGDVAGGALGRGRRTAADMNNASSSLEEEKIYSSGLDNRKQVAVSGGSGGSGETESLLNHHRAMLVTPLSPISPDHVDELGAGDDKHRGKAPTKTTSQLLVIIGTWYVTSVVSVYLQRLALVNYNVSPPALTLFSQGFTVFMGFIVIRMQKSGGVLKLSKERFVDLILPLGLTWGSTSVFYNLAMTAIPVSFLNTIKSSIPLWTCLICRTWMGAKFTMLTYFALVPLIGGVVIATLSEVGFTTFGFTVAIFSAISNTLFNIFAKRALNHPSKALDQQSCQLYTSICCIVLIAPVWIFSTNSEPSVNATEMPMVHDDSGVGGSLDEVEPFSIDWGLVGVLTAIGGIYYTEILAAYTLLASIAPLGFSISDVVRRLVVILSSIAMFGNTVTGNNALGICITMFGVLLYNISRNQDALDKLSSCYIRGLECVKRCTKQFRLMKKSGDLSIPKIVAV